MKNKTIDEALPKADKDSKPDEVEKEIIEVEPEVKDVAVAIDAPTDVDSFYADESSEDDTIDYIPNLKIAQKGDHIGKLYSPDMEQEWDEMNVALLRVSDSRCLWPEIFDKDNLPLCRSHNAVMPACDIPEDPEAEEKVFLPPMAGNCTDCSYSKWTKNAKGKQDPPRCLAIKDLLLLDMEDNIPFFYSVYSIALSPYNKKLKKPMTLRKMALTAKRSRDGKSPAHVSMFSFKLSTVLDQRPAGDAYIPVFSDIEELDDELKQFTGSVAMQLRDFKARSVIEAQPSGAAEEEAF